MGKSVLPTSTKGRDNIYNFVRDKNETAGKGEDKMETKGILRMVLV